MLLWQQIHDKDYGLSISGRYFPAHADSIYERLLAFFNSGVVKQLVPVASQRLDEFMPIFLQHTLQVEKPTPVIERFLSILTKIVQRFTYIALLIENQHKLTALLKLVEVSQWVTQYISMHLLLLDEILRMDRSYEPPSFDEMQQQLEVALQASSDGLEEFMECLREFKHAQVLQIAAADIVEAFPIMRVSDHLSWLAETCIGSAVNQAYQDLLNRHGEPICDAGGGSIYTRVANH